MCAGNSRDVAGLGELVKTLCHQIVLSIIIAFYVLRKSGIIALRHYLLNILWKK